MSFGKLVHFQVAGCIFIGVLTVLWPSFLCPWGHLFCALVFSCSCVWDWTTTFSCSLSLDEVVTGRWFETAFLVTRLWNSLSLSRNKNVPLCWEPVRGAPHFDLRLLFPFLGMSV